MSAPVTKLALGLANRHVNRHPWRLIMADTVTSGGIERRCSRHLAHHNAFFT
jgi:hypothetical protein